MTEAQQRTQTRDAILQDLEAAAPISLRLETLGGGIRRVHAINVTDGEIKKHLDYLIEKGLVEETASKISAGDKRYKLTGDGRDYLESEGLI